MVNPITIARALFAFGRLAWDPGTGTDRVLGLIADIDDSGGKQKLLESLSEDPDVREAIARKPELGHIDVDALEELPVGTLGHAFAGYLRSHGFDVGDITPDPNDEGTDADYAVNHLRATHDIWHTVTGFGTDVAGELGLQAFYLAQIQGPVPLILLAGGLLNGLRQGPDEVARRMDLIAAGWRLGRAARPLFGVDWAARWDRPLTEIRSELALAA